MAACILQPNRMVLLLLCGGFLWMFVILHLSVKCSYSVMSAVRISQQGHGQLYGSLERTDRDRGNGEGRSTVGGQQDPLVEKPIERDSKVDSFSTTGWTPSSAARSQKVSHSTHHISNRDLKQQLELLLRRLNADIEQGDIRELTLQESHLHRQIKRLSKGQFLLSSNLKKEEIAPGIQNESSKIPFRKDNSKNLKGEFALPFIDGFPDCLLKIFWMTEFWRTDPCYARNGVNQTVISSVIYLSEVENWCPPLPGRPKRILKEVSPAAIRPSLAGLYEALSRKEFAWLLQRVHSMENVWLKAGHSLERRQNLTKRESKKILVHMGLVSKESGFQMAESAFYGGPLGELVQWADLLTSLHVLGHNLTLSASTDDLKRVFSHSNCFVPKMLDLIYVDIIGLLQIKALLGLEWLKYKCIIRVLDTFGTEPEYNHNAYSKANNLTTFWGGHDLNPKQFYTMFPHTPDNTFLGFVVEHSLSFNEAQHLQAVTRNNQALVYGKRASFWKGKDKYLGLIHKHTEVYSTVYEKSSRLIPPYVKNHGTVSGTEVQQLLRQSKVFVGLSFPYEGPAPLEAIANGCAFLNPRFQAPHSRWNTHFFEGKPTARRLTSQHPYAEAIGKPYVWTVDIQNSTEVEQALISILNQTLEPYLPYEFSCEGMLQRVNTFIEKQDLCGGPGTWPPLSALRVVQADPSTSCTRACQKAGLVCEPAFFPNINGFEELISYGVSCLSESAEDSLTAPAFDPLTRHCVFQTDPLLFSCAANHTSLTRVCPCRDFIKDQVALCHDCL